MTACSALCQQWRRCWFHTNHLYIWLLFFQISAYTCQCTTSTNPCNKNIHFSICILVNFWTCCFIMCLWIACIVELSWYKRIWNFFCQFFRLCNRASHTFCAFCQNQFCTKSSHQQSAFHTHAIWHNDDCFISSCCRHHRQTNPCISACWFDDCRTWF